MFDADRASKAKESVRNRQALLVRKELRGEMFEIVFSWKILLRFRFTPKLSDEVVVITEESDFLYSLQK